MQPFQSPVVDAFPHPATHQSNQAVGDIQQCDVAIIGGGPAGAVTALRLLQQTSVPLRVVLIEREPFPRFKVCGCCLNGAAARTLRQVGMDHLLSEQQALPLHRWEAALHGHHVHADLPAGWALSRERLDTALLEQVRASGGDVWQPANAKIRFADEERVILTVRRSDIQNSPRTLELHANQVVFASGLAGGDLQQWLPWKTAPRGPIGLGAHIPPSNDGTNTFQHDYQTGVIYMAVSDAGYAGVVRLENGALDVAAAIYPPSDREEMRGIAARVAQILEDAGMPPIKALEQVQWKGTPRLQRRRVPGRGRILAVGDAGGYIEPFTGEGMAWAMQTGQLAADTILDCLTNLTNNYTTGAQVGDQYATRYHKQLAKRTQTCRWVASTLRHPWSRHLMFSALRWAPWLAKPVIHRLNHAAASA